MKTSLLDQLRDVSVRIAPASPPKARADFPPSVVLVLGPFVFVRQTKNI